MPAATRVRCDAAAPTRWTPTAAATRTPPRPPSCRSAARSGAGRITSCRSSSRPRCTPPRPDGAVVAAGVKTFVCPARRSSPVAHNLAKTDYAGNAGTAGDGVERHPGALRRDRAGAAGGRDRRHLEHAHAVREAAETGLPERRRPPPTTTTSRRTRRGGTRTSTAAPPPTRTRPAAAGDRRRADRVRPLPRAAGTANPYQGRCSSAARTRRR